MVDPMAEVIALLKPRAVYSKVISGAGAWAVRYSAFGQPSFCTMLQGQCVLAVHQQPPVTLAAGDFVLMPATPGFTLSSPEPAVPVFLDPAAMQDTVGELRHGRQTGDAEVRMLGGHFLFDSPDASLLVSLLPVLLHVRGVERLTVLMRLVRDIDDGNAWAVARFDQLTGTRLPQELANQLPPISWFAASGQLQIDE